MRGLVLAQSVNKPGRADASGAFVPSAKHFCRFHGLPDPVWLDDVDDKAKMLKAIGDSRGLDTIAYFGHGDANRLGSADIGAGDIPALADAIMRSANAGCQVILYACFSGIVGGFAEKLASRLMGKVRVWGHSCKGHTYTNPYVTRYPYLDEDDQPYLIEPLEGGFDPKDAADRKVVNPFYKGTRTLPQVPRTEVFKKWYKAIKTDGADIQARFPFMTKRMVELEVITGIRMSLSIPQSMVDAAEKGWLDAQKHLAKAVKHAQHAQKHPPKHAHH